MTDPGLIPSFIYGFLSTARSDPLSADPEVSPGWSNTSHIKVKLGLKT